MEFLKARQGAHSKLSKKEKKEICGYGLRAWKYQFVEEFSGPRSICDGIECKNCMGNDIKINFLKSISYACFTLTE